MDNCSVNGLGRNIDFFQHPLRQKRLVVMILAIYPPLTSVWMLQVQPVSHRDPRGSISHGQVGNFHAQAWALVRFIYTGASSPVLCLSLPGDKCPHLPFTSRCAESLSEIKPLYSKVNDACFAVQSLCLLSTVPITECRCHRWCNSIVLKGFRPPFFEQVIFSLNSNQISSWIGSVVSGHCGNSPAYQHRFFF